MFGTPAAPGAVNRQAVERFVRERSRTFRYASALLPPERRYALRVAYAFFRMADDMVDRAARSPAEFHAWRDQAMRPAGEQSDPVLAAWAMVRERYAVNPTHVQNLLDGIERDADRQRYAALADLHAYCYRVASSAGLMIIPIVGLRRGATFVQAEPYAAKLGLALQMTNILRDVGEDLRQGRIYLPEAELAAFGLSYADVEAQVHDERFRQLMAHLIRATRRLYAEAWPGLGLLSSVGRVAIGVGALVYYALLDEIARLDYDVFTRRARPTLFRNIRTVITGWPAVAWPEYYRPPRPAPANSGNV